MGFLEPWHVVVLVAVLFLLFGYKRLPSATKSIAQSMKIFRDETKGMIGGEHKDETPAAGDLPVAANTGAGALAAPTLAAPPVPQPVAAQPVAAQPVAAQPVAAPPAPVVVPAPVSVAPPAPAPVAAPAQQPSLAPRPTVHASGDQQSR